MVGYGLVAGILLLIIAMFVYGYLANFEMNAKCYSEYRMYLPDSSGKEPVRLIFLTDLHGWIYGKENEKLLMQIKKGRPDLICIVGDMTVKEGEGCKSALSLCSKLIQIAPVYYAVGNHEIRMPQYEKYITDLEKIGITVLRNQSALWEKDSIKCRIYGLDLPLESYYRGKKKIVPTTVQIEELLSHPVKKDDEITILLAHNPMYFSLYHSWNPDLVLSGHLHGGIMILPFLGGVIGPDFKFFPKYYEGAFREEDTFLIVSRGLGTHHLPFRFFNRPEVVGLQIVPGEKRNLERK
ncbi:MAG: metallophosphoesterase [Eubacterium sp.]